MKSRYGIAGLIALFMSLSSGALPIGSWNIHLPYYSCQSITSSATSVWAATDNSLFKLNKADFSTEKITKIEGLSDLSISCTAFNAFNNVLVVGYGNGNLDLIKGGKIYNLPDIMRSQIVANKSIHRIYFINNLAYLSTGFGIVVIDTENNEVIDTYLIGPNGSYLSVYDIISDGVTIYAATATGLYRAQLSDPFLANYQSWTQFPGLPTGVYNNVEIFNGSLIVSQSRFIVNNHFREDTIRYYDNTNMVWVVADTAMTVRNLSVMNNQLWICDAWGVIIQDNNFMSTAIFYQVNNSAGLYPKDFIPQPDGTVWCADQFLGLVHMTDSDHGTIYRPNGPASTSAAAMDFSNGRLCAVPGGRGDAWNNIYNTDGISFYQSQHWDVMMKSEVPALDSIVDINFCEIDPADNTHVWLGSWGNGLVEVRNNAIVNQYNQYNSILESKIEYPWCGIGGIRYDEKGNLWMVNSNTAKCLKVIKADGTWQLFDFQGLVTTSTTVGDLMITENGQKWMLLPGTAGIIVFDDHGTIDNIADDRKVKLGFTEGAGGMPGTEVHCMAEDHDNEVWVGTDKGIGVFYCADNILNAGGCDAQQILIQQGEYTQLLMESQVVTTIAVDGANRKWIGTANGGVFLMSEDGTEEILHFTADNSPLLNDNVTGVSIDPQSGEVFFSTSKGICSYKSDAVEGDEVMGDVYAYPNPVQPTYHGPIAIRGLVRDADVKITDVGGNVVYQTTALGGQATWDGNNFAGERAASGVYLVFITNEDGTQRRVTKVLLMN